MVSIICLSSVTFVHPTQMVKLFGNIFTRFCTLGIWEGTPPPGALHTRGVGETGQSERFVTNVENGAITCIPINNNE